MTAKPDAARIDGPRVGGAREGFIDWKRLAVGWVWTCLTVILGAGFVHVTIGSRTYKLASWMFEDWVLGNEVPPLQSILGMAAVLLGWSFFLALGYALFYRGIPGTGWRKGLFYGLMIWALCGVSMELFDLNTTKIPTAISLTWILQMFVVAVAAGLALGFVYPGRRMLKEPGTSFEGHYPGGAGTRKVAGTIWRDILDNRLRFILAVAATGVFIVGWDALAFFATRGFYEKAESILRAGAIEGRFSALQLFGLAIAVGYTSVAFVLSYLIIRRGLPLGGWKGGLIFGSWLGIFTIFPLGLTLLNGFHMATSSVLVTMVLIPLVQFIGMGLLAGLLLPGGRR